MGAQGPNNSGNYYQAADGKKGAALKTALCGIIYNRTERTYGDLWEDFRTTDVREDGKVWDMYSGISNFTFGDNQDKGSGKNEGEFYNREHSWPNSWFGGKVQPMYTDLHHLYPTDKVVNNKRSNHPFGETNGESYKSANSFSKLGKCTYAGYGATVFEPNDEYKGDFARTYFYMVTCYEEKIVDWYTNYGVNGSNAETKNAVMATLDGQAYPGFSVWQLEMLMKWAKNDPVSKKETDRNNAVYGIQKNRNPFIDYPGLEEYIWGDKVTIAFSYDNYDNQIIHNLSFADANVKAICVANWDTNGDGELSESEAAAVTDLGTVFQGNHTITSFDELRYFTKLTSIGDFAFDNCSSLFSITIPNSVTSIGRGTFYGCTGLNSVTIPNSVTSIGRGAFASCSGLTSITIPNSVTRIGIGAFEFCTGLNSITIPNSVTSIGRGAFASCSGLTSVNVEEGNTKYDSRENCNAIIETSSNSLIAGCKNSTIPNSVTTIGDYAFFGCSGLTSITIPNSVTSIGERAFYYTGLTSITITNSVTRIGDDAFNNCSSLTSIISEIMTPFVINENMFTSYTYSTAQLTVPAGTKSAYQSTAGWNKFSNIVEYGAPTTYSLSITASSGGSVTYAGNTISGSTKSFNVNERTSATLTFTPDNGYRLKSVIVNGTDVTSIVSNNQYTISNINANTTVSVTFEASSSNSSVLYYRKYALNPTDAETIEELGYNSTKDWTAEDKKFADWTKGIIGMSGSLADYYYSTAANQSGANHDEHTHQPADAWRTTRYAYSNATRLLAFQSQQVIKDIRIAHTPSTMKALLHNGQYIGSHAATEVNTHCGYCALEDANHEYHGGLHLMQTVGEAAGLGTTKFKDSPAGSFAPQDSVGYTDSLNLNKLVEVHYTVYDSNGENATHKKMTADEIANKFGLHFEFELTGLYYGSNTTSESAHAAIKKMTDSNGTDEFYMLRPQMFDTELENGVWVGHPAPWGNNGINNGIVGKQDRQTIGHTPIVRVKLLDGDNNIVDYGYIRIKIVGNNEAPIPPTKSLVNYNVGKMTYSSSGGEPFYWKNSIDNIGLDLGTNGKDFVNNYEMEGADNIFTQYYMTNGAVKPCTCTEYGHNHANDTLGLIRYIPNIDEDQNSFIEWNVTKTQLKKYIDNIGGDVTKANLPRYIKFKKIGNIDGPNEVYVCITPAGLENNSTPATYTLTISSSGNGSVSYNGKTIRGNSSSFTINEGASATLTFTPDNGYRIKSVTVNGTDVTTSVSNNKYTVSNIRQNTTVSVSFELEADYSFSGIVSWNNRFNKKNENYWYAKNANAQNGQPAPKGYDEMHANVLAVEDKLAREWQEVCKVLDAKLPDVFSSNDGGNANELVHLDAAGAGLNAWVTTNSSTVKGKNLTALTFTFAVADSLKNTQYTGNNGFEYKMTVLPKTSVDNTQIEGKALIAYRDLNGNNKFEKTIEPWDTVATLEVLGVIANKLDSINHFRIKYHNNSIADALLNYKAHDELADDVLNVIVAAKAWYNDYEVPLYNNTLSARFLRPVNVFSNDYVVESTGSPIINLRDLVHFTDWRDEPFKTEVQNDYWHYYNIRAIKPTNVPDGGKLSSNTKVKTNMDGGSIVSLADKTQALEIIYYDATPATPKAVGDYGTADSFGTLVCSNLSYTGQEFDVWIPITVTYEWGDIYTTANVHFANTPQYTLSISSSGNGYVTYSGNAISGTTQIYSIKAGSSHTLTFTSDDGYRLKSVIVNGTDVTSGVSNNQYTISNIQQNTTVEVTFEAIPPTTYTLTIIPSGNGSVLYNATTIRNATKVFTVVEGTSHVLTFDPDDANYLEAVKVNGADVTPSVSNNQYTLNDISENTTVVVTFKEELKDMSVNNVNYKVTSFNEKTVNVAAGSYGRVLTVPETFNYDGQIWMVKGIESGALANETDLAAIVWNPNVAFTESVPNPNLLLYVKSSSYAPKTVNNVIVNSVAAKITLTEAESGNDFYCPQAFTARSITYTHSYQMTTGIDDCQGWETIALPFDVQTIRHETKGVIVPFAAQTNSSQKAFWLYELTNNGWRAASAIKANSPYIISMPNNDLYFDEVRLNGRVTFSATDVTVPVTTTKMGSYKNRMFVANFGRQPRSETFYTLNVNNEWYANTYGEEGSLFIVNQRSVSPFEAYMITTYGARESFGIFEDMTTEIRGVEEMVDARRVSIYNMSGQKRKTPGNESIDELKRKLPAGVYIINGQKVIVR